MFSCHTDALVSSKPLSSIRVDVVVGDQSISTKDTEDTSKAIKYEDDDEVCDDDMNRVEMMIRI